MRAKPNYFRKKIVRERILILKMKNPVSLVMLANADWLPEKNLENFK